MKTGELVIKLKLDTSEFDAALAKMRAALDEAGACSCAAEVRKQLLAISRRQGIRFTEPD